MQASKVRIGATYAVERSEQLVRFKVTAVVTRRVKNHGNPHDYESTVEGYVLEDLGASTQTIKPTALIGPYEESVELRERADQERLAKEQAEESARLARVKLVDLLYSKLNVPQTKFPDDYDQPFRVDYGSVDIRKEGIQLLLDYLEQAK